MKPGVMIYAYIPAFRKLKQKDPEFESNLGYLVSLYLQKQ
jgi:hypothetical protein